MYAISESTQFDQLTILLPLLIARDARGQIRGSLKSSDPLFSSSPSGAGSIANFRSQRVQNRHQRSCFLEILLNLRKISSWKCNKCKFWSSKKCSDTPHELSKKSLRWSIFYPLCTRYLTIFGTLSIRYLSIFSLVRPDSWTPDRAAGGYDLLTLEYLCEC